MKAVLYPVRCSSGRFNGDLIHFQPGGGRAHAQQFTSFKVVRTKNGKLFIG